MRLYALALVGSVVCFASSVHADVLWFSGSNKLEGHVLRKTRDNTNFKLIYGGNLVVENHDISRTETEPFVVYLLKRGDYYLNERKDADQALKNYRDALKLKPDDPYIAERIELVVLTQRIERCQEGIELARRQSREGDLQDSIDTYKELLPTAPKDELQRTIRRELAETYANLAYKFFDHSYFLGAEQMLREAEQLNPSSPRLHFVLGRILHISGDWQGAEREYQLAAELDPNIPRLAVYQAEVRQNLQFNQEAAAPPASR
jgi:tetratricopeptide (TPR) repeat protein